jgi:hypothetical protein
VKKTQFYRKTTLATLSSLNYLDDSPVFEAEQRSVAAWKAGGREAELKAKKVGLLCVPCAPLWLCAGGGCSCVQSYAAWWISAVHCCVAIGVGGYYSRFVGSFCWPLLCFFAPACRSGVRRRPPSQSAPCRRSSLGSKRWVEEVVGRLAGVNFGKAVFWGGGVGAVGIAAPVDTVSTALGAGLLVWLPPPPHPFCQVRDRRAAELEELKAQARAEGRDDSTVTLPTVCHVVYRTSTPAELTAQEEARRAIARAEAVALRTGSKGMTMMDFSAGV